MGAWGPGIFSDDLASDIRYEYNTLLSFNIPDEEAFKLIKEYFFEEGSEEEPTFWFAIALCQWNKGRLMESVKRKALENIEQDLLRWKQSGKEGEYKKRKKVLEEFKDKILSPMPVRKKVSKTTTVHSPWEVGDLLAFKLTNVKIKETEYYNKYVLLRVIGIHRTPVSQIIKQQDYDDMVMFGLYNWSGEEAPSIDKLDELEYIPLNEHDDILLGHILETHGMIGWSKKELNSRDIIVIDNDSSYENKLPDFFDTSNGICVSIYSFSNIEQWISKALKKYKITN